MTRLITHYYHPANLAEGLAAGEVLDGDFYLMGGRTGAPGGGDAKRAYYSAALGVWIRKREDGKCEMFDYQLDPEAPKGWTQADTTSYDISQEELLKEHERLVTTYQEREERVLAALAGTESPNRVPDEVWTKAQELETALAHKEELLRDAEVKLDQQSKRIEELENMVESEVADSSVRESDQAEQIKKLQEKLDGIYTKVWECVDETATFQELRVRLEDEGIPRPREEVVVAFGSAKGMKEKDVADLEAWLRSRGITDVSFS